MSAHKANNGNTHCRFHVTLGLIILDTDSPSHIYVPFVPIVADVMETWTLVIRTEGLLAASRHLEKISGVGQVPTWLGAALSGLEANGQHFGR